MMPNVKTNLIKCEYSLKETSYFDYFVLGKDRFRVEMLIYVAHQLQKDMNMKGTLIKIMDKDKNLLQEISKKDFVLMEK